MLSPLAIFFISLCTGIVFLVLGVVLLFRKSSEFIFGAQTVGTVTSVVLRQPYQDYVITISYQVNKQRYNYSFLRDSKQPSLSVGSKVMFIYDVRNPWKEAPLKFNTPGHLLGLGLVFFGLSCIVAGSIWAYYLSSVVVEEKGVFNIFK